MFLCYFCLFTIKNYPNYGAIMRIKGNNCPYNLSVPICLTLYVCGTQQYPGCHIVWEDCNQQNRPFCPHGRHEIRTNMFFWFCQYHSNLPHQFFCLLRDCGKSDEVCHWNLARFYYYNHLKHLLIHF